MNPEKRASETRDARGASPDGNNTPNQTKCWGTNGGGGCGTVRMGLRARHEWNQQRPTCLLVNNIQARMNE